MALINKDKVISELKLTPTGSKGWYNCLSKEDLLCPYCNKGNGRVAIIFGGISSWKCVRCGKHGRLEHLLKKIGRKDLVPKYKDVDEKEIFERKELITSLKKELNIEELPECLLPVQFKRISNSNYLNSRGCNKHIYNNWIIGKTDFKLALKDFIIFVVTENGKNVGWVARSLKSKEYIDNFNKNNDFFMLRWRNSEGDFSKMVFGIDEITENTETVIIVEGITSKMNTDVQLELYSDESIKCVCTFGKKMDDVQIYKILSKGTNIQQVILFYDTDAVQAAKSTAFRLEEFISNVFIAHAEYKDDEGNYKDAGDLKFNEFEEVFNNLKKPFNFYNSVLPIRSLI